MSPYEIFAWGFGVWIMVCVAFRMACEFGPPHLRGCWLCGLRIHRRI